MTSTINHRVATFSFQYFMYFGLKLFCSEQTEKVMSCLHWQLAHLLTSVDRFTFQEQLKCSYLRTSVYLLWPSRLARVNSLFCSPVKSLFCLYRIKGHQGWLDIPSSTSHALTLHVEKNNTHHFLTISRFGTRLGFRFEFGLLSGDIETTYHCKEPLVIELSYDYEWQWGWLKREMMHRKEVLQSIDCRFTRKNFRYVILILKRAFSFLSIDQS